MSQYHEDLFKKFSAAATTDLEKEMLHEIDQLMKYPDIPSDCYERQDWYARNLSDALNGGTSPKKLAEKMAQDHPTLQQLFFRTCLEFMRLEALKKENGYYDLRNKGTVESCYNLWKKYQEVGEPCPFI